MLKRVWISLSCAVNDGLSSAEQAQRRKLYAPPTKKKVNHKAKHPKRKKCRSRSLLHSPKLIFRYQRCS